MRRSLDVLGGLEIICHKHEDDSAALLPDGLFLLLELLLRVPTQAIVNQAGRSELSFIIAVETRLIALSPLK